MASSTTSNQRRQNRSIVLREIVTRAPVSRTHISQHTGLTGAAVSRITRELIEVGLVSEGKTMRIKGQVGRRNICLKLVKGGAYILGISLTANVQSVSISNSDGEIVASNRIRNLDLGQPEMLVEQLGQAALDLVKTSGINHTRLVGCGIAIGGVADGDTGVLIRSDPLGWYDVDIGKMFSEKLNLPVKLEGRAVALLSAEQKGGLVIDKQNVVLISNDLWVGGAVMLDGKIIKGKANMVGQIGHMSMGDTKTLCSCGRKGCLDAVASGLSILKKLENLGLPETTDPLDRIRQMADGPLSTQPEIVGAFKEAGQNMGFAVDALLAMLDPEQVLLTGITHRHPAFLDGIKETLGGIRPEQWDFPVAVSNATSDQSAVWVGLNAFVFSPFLNIDKLKAA